MEDTESEHPLKVGSLFLSSLAVPEPYSLLKPLLLLSFQDIRQHHQTALQESCYLCQRQKGYREAAIASVGSRKTPPCLWPRDRRMTPHLVTLHMPVRHQQKPRGQPSDWSLKCCYVKPGVSMTELASCNNNISRKIASDQLLLPNLV